MAIQVGPRFFSITPPDAAHVRVTLVGGSSVTLAEPITVDELGRVSFAVSLPGDYYVHVTDENGYGAIFRILVSSTGESGAGRGAGTLRDYIETRFEALTSRLPTVLHGARVVVDGDSITIGGVSNNILGSIQDKGSAWPTYMEAASDGRMQLVRNAGVAGQRSWEILARFDTAVAPYAPNLVIATFGTNNMGTPGGASISGWLADLEAYRLKCEAIGARLVVGAIYPTASNNPVGRSGDVAIWNSAMRSWAKTHGVRVLPFDSLADPTTGGWPSGWSSDLIHPDSGDGPQRLGIFAWQAISDLFGARVIGTADRLGPGEIVNGLFTGSTSTGSPATITATASTASGSLAAATYSYRVSARAYMGESLLTVPRSVTLASTGNVTVGWSTVSGARGYHVYRRGPEDFDWYRVATFESGATSSWIDDGTAVPGERATGADTSAIPTDIGFLTLATARSGAGLFYDPGIRGRYLRLRTREDTAGEYGFILTGQASTAGTVSAGETWELTGLVRGDGLNPAYARMRLRTGSNTVYQIYAYRDYPPPGNAWGRFRLRVTIPAGQNIDNLAPMLTVGPKYGTDEGYVDFAEVRVAKIS